MDLTQLSEEELDLLRRDVLIEQERRANLANLPEQVRALADQYEACGGNRADLAEQIGH